MHAFDVPTPLLLLLLLLQGPRFQQSCTVWGRGH
jgi:hypothetical protein